MSALTLRKVPGNALGAHDVCLDTRCNAKGRYSVQIAGYVLAPESRLAESHVARLCMKHAAEWKKLWAELSGATALKEVEAAIARLRDSTPERTEAIFELRELGLCNEEVTRALAWTGDGLSVEQILEGLIDGAEGMGVAA